MHLWLHQVLEGSEKVPVDGRNIMYPVPQSKHELKCKLWWVWRRGIPKRMEGRWYDCVKHLATLLRNDARFFSWTPACDTAWADIWSMSAHMDAEAEGAQSDTEFLAAEQAFWDDYNCRHRPVVSSISSNTSEDF